MAKIVVTPWFYFGLGAIGLTITLAAYLFPDEFRAFVNAVPSYLAYLIPLVLGFLLYRSFYLNNRDEVIIFVSNLEKGQFGAVAIAAQRFARMECMNGAINIFATVTGKRIVFAKSIDLRSNTIDAGHVHKLEECHPILLTYKSVLDELLRLAEESARENAIDKNLWFGKAREWAIASVMLILGQIDPSDRVEVLKDIMKEEPTDVVN